MNKIFLLFSWLISSVSYGQQTNESIDIGGVNRTYIQYLPVGFQTSENMPAVILLHGIGDSGAGWLGAGFNDIADSARFVVIYADGLPNNFSQNSWNNGTLLASTADDISFMNGIMDDLILNKNVDPSRIYVSGFSMGSIMAYRLACQLNSRIAAIGTMSGPMSDPDFASCSPAYKTPVIHFHGTLDATLTYGGSPLPTMTNAIETIGLWEGLHSCDGTYDSIRMPDNAPSDGITVDKFVYNGCSSTNPLELWRMNNADHQYIYEPTNDVTEGFEIWRFFRRFYHPNPAAASLNENSEIEFGVYPNPCSDVMTISYNSELDYKLTDFTGRVIQQGTSNKINVSEIPSGSYLLIIQDTSIRSIEIIH